MKNYKYIINGETFNVDVGERKDGITTVIVNNETYNVELIPELKEEKKSIIRKPDATQKKDESKNYLQDALRAPIPGTVIDICTNVGDSVKEGDTLLVLEAMKMNNNLTAEKDGVVREILTQAGETVKENTPLITFE